MQTTPPGRAGPWATREAAPDCPPDREQMALLPPEPEAGSPGDAVRWSREARTPTLHSETHNCFLSLLMRLLSPRKEVCEAPTFLPSHRRVPSRPPQAQLLLSGLFLAHPQPDRPLGGLGPSYPRDRGSPPGLLLAAQRVDAALFLLSPMDICHQGRSTVTTESPRRVCGPEDGCPFPESLHLLSWLAHALLTCPGPVPFSPTWGLIPSMVMLLPPSWSLPKHL